MATTTTRFDRDTMAAWYANRHLTLALGGERVFHLPNGASPREIRFVEVGSHVREVAPLEPVDFGVAIDGPDAHQLIVLDLTAAQWNAVQRGRLPLPDDWSSARSVKLGRS